MNSSDISEFRVRLHLVLQTLLIFVLVYFSSNWFATRTDSVRYLAMEWERSIPFIPEFVYIYLSIFVVIFLPVFVLKLQPLQIFAKQCTVAILLSGVVFFLYPASVAFERTSDPESLNFALYLLRRLDLPFNTFPSLHVSLSILSARALHQAYSKKLSVLSIFWVLLTILSILLIHQHHIIDIIGGVCVALFVAKRFRY